MQTSTELDTEIPATVLRASARRTSHRRAGYCAGGPRKGCGNRSRRNAVLALRHRRPRRMNTRGDKCIRAARACRPSTPSLHGDARRRHTWIYTRGTRMRHGE